MPLPRFKGMGNIDDILSGRDAKVPLEKNKTNEGDIVTAI